jgi:hypothetical protein
MIVRDVGHKLGKPVKTLIKIVNFGWADYATGCYVAADSTAR